MNLCALIERSALINGAATALVDGQVRHTWREARDRIARLAAGLQSIGCENGDRIAILGLNSHRYFECIFAAAWAGGVMVPINIRLAAPEMAHCLNDSGTSILFVDDAFIPLVEQLADQVESLRHVVYMGAGEASGCSADHESLIAEHAAIGPIEHGPDDVSGLFYTGGTTGLSKGVMLSHANQVTNALQTQLMFNMDRQSNYLNVAPMFHAANMIGMLNATMAAATHVFVPAFEPEAVLRTIEKERVSHSVMVPTMINMLLHQPRFEDYDLASLKRLGYGGSPMAESVIAGIKERLPGLEMAQAYGLTETSPVLTVLLPEYHTFDGPQAGKTRSAGQPVAAVELRILDQDGRACATGEVGEVCARGPNIMRGYWNLPEQTAQVLQDGWFRTGDSGYLDADGFLFISDRVKDMIVTGGENVYSIEVENALYRHPAVASCAVIGIPSEQWGEEVHAVVVIADGQAVDDEALIRHCQTLIAGYKCPRSISFSDQPLPLSGAGKILKRVLRDRFWQGRDRQIG